jgi:O-antigen/teichoic acid export membrane protein
VRAPPLGSWLRRSRDYVWGFVDQAFSSATNFGLFVIAGRELGPRGLGVVTISISAYLLALGFQRSLLTTPLVAASAALKIEHRVLAIRTGLTIGLVGALGATLLLLLLGLVIPGNVGRAFLIIAPWLLPALIQDFWRAVLFQERRAKAAVANDAMWALFMGLTAPLAWFFATDWAIVGCWGAGALAGALLGFAQTRAQPISASVAFSWWRMRLWPFGRWLGLEGAIYAVTTSGTVFVLNGLLGPSALGGLRAAQSIFAPLTLILPAIALPGLPAVARALTASSGAAIRLAAALSGLVGALAALYVGAMVLLGGRLIPYVFGSSFAGFTNLAGPIGTWQLVGGLGAGFGIFLTAQQRGRDLLVIRVTGAVASTVFISLLAWTSGVVGAAWGFALGAGFATALTIALAVRSYERSARDQARRPEEKGIADA